MITLHHGNLYHAAARAIALVNAAPAEYAAVLADHGETNLRGLDDELGEVAAVVAELRGVLGIDDRDQAARRLNQLLAYHGAVPQLVRHEGWDWHLHVDRVDDTWANWLSSSAALALAARLAARTGVPWGICAADGCGRAFLDDGHGGSRRYCSPTCATRQRVRNHRAARKTGSVRSSRPDRVDSYGQNVYPGG